MVKMRVLLLSLFSSSDSEKLMGSFVILDQHYQPLKGSLETGLWDQRANEVLIRRIELK